MAVVVAVVMLLQLWWQRRLEHVSGVEPASCGGRKRVSRSNVGNGGRRGGSSERRHG
jgi:hypothetical protein